MKSIRFTAEEETAMRDAPEVPRLTPAELEDLWREIQESRRLQSHLSRVERASELAREKATGY